MPIIKHIKQLGNMCWQIKLYYYCYYSINGKPKVGLTYFACMFLEKVQNMQAKS